MRVSTVTYAPSTLESPHMLPRPCRLHSHVPTDPWHLRHLAPHLSARNNRTLYKLCYRMRPNAPILIPEDEAQTPMFTDFTPAMTPTRYLASPPPSRPIPRQPDSAAEARAHLLNTCAALRFYCLNNTPSNPPDRRPEGVYPATVTQGPAWTLARSSRLDARLWQMEISESYVQCEALQGARAALHRRLPHTA